MNTQPSETPRVDEVDIKLLGKTWEVSFKAMRDKARALERELNEANKELIQVKSDRNKWFNKMNDYESYIIKAQTAEAKAVKNWEECSEEVERLEKELSDTKKQIDLDTGTIERMRQDLAEAEEKIEIFNINADEEKAHIASLIQDGVIPPCPREDHSKTCYLSAVIEMEKVINKQKEELSELRRDKARLDWLESQLNDTYEVLAHHAHPSSVTYNPEKYDRSKPYAVGDLLKYWGETLRAAIDQAMNQKG